MYSALNTLSDYTDFNIPKMITSYTFLFVFKIVESQSILKVNNGSARTASDICSNLTTKAINDIVLVSLLLF